MTLQPVHDPKTPIGEILKASGFRGDLAGIRRPESRFALIPLDDDVIDFLIELNFESDSPCTGSPRPSTPASSRLMRQVRSNWIG